MLVFGLIVLGLVWLRMRGRQSRSGPPDSSAPPTSRFGACALLLSNFDKFFLVFVVPGILLTTAAALRD